jgi:vacuolar-type H+-ATPase subunit H
MTAVLASTALQSLSGTLFEEFFRSIVEQESFDDSQKEELAKYLQGAIEKRDRLGEFIARMEAEAEAIRGEEKRLGERRKGFEKIADSIRSSIHQQMLDWGVKKVEGKLFTFAVQANPASVEITDESLIPGDYIDYKPQVDRNKLKDALKAGQEVPGARLVTDRTSLRIK